MQNNPNNQNRPSRLNDKDWNTLLRRIRENRCTPFLGAGVNSGLLPLGFQIAQRWAQKYDYPFKDSSDLARVAQYLAFTEGPDVWTPKEELQREFRKRIGRTFSGKDAPNFIAPNHPLGVLAALPLSIYVTTNYDDFMFRALRANGKRPWAEFCEWSRENKDQGGVVYSETSAEVTGFQKSQLSSTLPPASPFSLRVETPLVFHLHGHYELLESMVLTENDYLDFLVKMWMDPNMLHPKIKYALTGNSLLFMGFSLADPDFRVLYRGLIHPLASNRRLSVSIQLRPGDLQQPNEQRALDYLEKYFDDFNIKVFWGTAEEFAEKLWQKWNSPAPPQNDEDDDDY